MAADLSHFAINADDVPASKAFYEKVFGWTFHAWGPPGFYRVATGPDGIQGALQQRRSLLPEPTRGVEATFAVDDVDATAEAVRAAGGAILMERFTIAGVGHLIFFEDPAGNPVGAMQYDPLAD
ncbi:VOC family protein [Pseudonocardia sp. WMMC193]|uniref:VOC family protein n=1 Tax=Pseudonocardia sp. WMMC193 TaxID=2911965 RepID=UPI001F2441EF|nr:VOC family protein [Pseudonocardia sp. WMMC193]MCF7549699.1 VOC family protein [Pseudonocardia sp. WMMC193]